MAAKSTALFFFRIATKIGITVLWQNMAKNCECITKIEQVFLSDYHLN